MKKPPLPEAYSRAIGMMREGASMLIQAVSVYAEGIHTDDGLNDVRLAISVLDQCNRLEKEGKE